MASRIVDRLLSSVLVVIVVTALGMIANIFGIALAMPFMSISVSV